MIAPTTSPQNRSGTPTVATSATAGLAQQGLLDLARVEAVARGRHVCGQRVGDVGHDVYGRSVVEVQVRSKLPGVIGDGLPEVLVDLATGVTTAAELIRLAVEEQIRLLRGDAARCRRALDRQYLSVEDICEQAANGVVRMPTGVPAAPDVAVEVARAHRAFERNVFVVFVGGRQLRGLEGEIVLRRGEPVV